jgi:hypothetical protein
MTILGKRNYKRLGGAVSVGFAGLLLASVAVAGHGEPDGWNDDDKDGWNDDDDKKDDDRRDKDDDDKDDDDKDGWNDDDDKKGGKGKQREPRFEDEGDSLKAEVEVRGLKNKGRVRAELEATAEVEIECRHKGKGHGKGKKKDFEKEIDIELEGTEFFNKNQIHGNRLDIEVETEEAEDALDDKYGDDGGCPGGYDRRIKKVQFLDAKLEVEQGKREVVTFLCTFDDPTRDGDVPRRDVDCHTLYD